MPTYEYKCRDCKHEFSLSMSLHDHDEKKVKCPKCKSTHVEWVPAPFFAVTTKKS